MYRFCIYRWCLYLKSCNEQLITKQVDHWNSVKQQMNNRERMAMILPKAVSAAAGEERGECSEDCGEWYYAIG